MTTVVSVISAKGGAGKTVFSLALAKFLAGLGLKVVVVDADASTNGATLFLLDEVVEFAEDRKVTPLGLFEQDFRPLHLDRVPTSHGFGFIPAAFRMRDTVVGAAAEVVPRMPEIVEHLRSSGTDVVIVDNEAGIEPSAVSSAAVSDRVVIVSEFDPISSQGILRLQRLHAEALPDGKTWVLFNKVLPDMADSIGDHLVAIKYLPPVGWTSDVVRRYAVNELDIDAEQPSDFTFAIAKVADILFTRRIRDRIAKWRAEVGRRFEAALTAHRLVLQNRVRASRWMEPGQFPLFGVVLASVPLYLVLGAIVYGSKWPAAVSLTTAVATLSVLLAVGLGVSKGVEEARSRSRARQELQEIELLLSPTRVDEVDLGELRRRMQALNTDLARREDS